MTAREWVARTLAAKPQTTDAQREAAVRILATVKPLAPGRAA